MYYVYYIHIDSGREDFCGIYENMKDAVAKIRLCLNTDAQCGAKNEYYYFIKKH